MKTKMICACKYAVIDKNTGRLSIINVLDTIKAPGLPLMIPEICLVLVSERQKSEPKSAETELSLKLNKKVLAKHPIKINFLDKYIHNFVFHINGLVINQAGTLSFIVKKDNRQIAKYECLVDIDTKKQPTIKVKK